MSQNESGATAPEKKARKPRAKPAKPSRKASPRKDADGKLINPNLEAYKVSKDVKTSSGRPAIDSDDNVARSLRGAKLEEVYREASKATGIPQTQLKSKYEKLNIGMQRMNLGNLIRGAATKAAKAKKAA